MWSKKPLVFMCAMVSTAFCLGRHFFVWPSTCFNRPPIHCLLAAHPPCIFCFGRLLTTHLCYRLILLNKLLEDGNTLYKKGRLEEAAVRYTYAAKRVPLGLDGSHQQVFHQLRIHLLLNLSRCRRKQQDHGEAARLASEALSLAPTCPEAFHARAKASHAAGRLEAALRDLTEAVRVAPQNRELHKILLTLKLEMKEKAKEQAEVKDSRDSSSGVCSSGEGSTKDFDQDNETSL